MHTIQKLLILAFVLADFQVSPAIFGQSPELAAYKRVLDGVPVGAEVPQEELQHYLIQHRAVLQQDVVLTVETLLGRGQARSSEWVQVVASELLAWPEIVSDESLSSAIEWYLLRAAEDSPAVMLSFLDSKCVDLRDAYDVWNDVIRSAQKCEDCGDHLTARQLLEHALRLSTNCSDPMRKEDLSLSTHIRLLHNCHLSNSDSSRFVSALVSFLAECPPENGPFPGPGDTSFTEWRNPHRRDTFIALRNHYAHVQDFEALGRLCQQASVELFGSTAYYREFIQDEFLERRALEFRLDWCVATARLWETVGLPEESLAWIDRAIALGGPETAALYRMHLYRRLGRISEAREVLARVKVDPKPLEDAWRGMFRHDGAVSWMHLQPALLFMAEGDRAAALHELHKGLPILREQCELAMLNSELPMALRLYELKIKPWLDVAVTLAVEESQDCLTTLDISDEQRERLVHAFEIVTSLQGLVDDVGRRQSDWGMDANEYKRRQNLARDAARLLRDGDSTDFDELTKQYLNYTDHSGASSRLTRFAWERGRDRYQRIGSASGRPSVEPSPWVIDLTEFDQEVDVLQFIRYRPFRASAPRREDEWGDPRYALLARSSRFSNSGDGENVRVFDLGACAPIDELIGQLHLHVRLEAESPEDAGTWTDLKATLTQLNERLIAPASGWLSAGTRHGAGWIIIPDGLLWQLPFEALCVPDGRFLVEVAPVSYAHSLRARFWAHLKGSYRIVTSLISSGDLGNYWGSRRPVFRQADGSPCEDLRLNNAWLHTMYGGRGGGHFAIFADPEFEPANPAALPESQTVQLGSEIESLRAGNLFGGTGVQRLLHSATEATAVETLLNEVLAGPSSNNNRRVAKHTGAECQEGLLSAGGGSCPEFLMVSTHGFQIPVDLTRASQNRIVHFDEPIQLFDPDGRPTQGMDSSLYRCGLLLAGCNAWIRGEDDRRADARDQVLTGAEILSMPLQGTQLVILSACQSGVRDSEFDVPLLGMREAFHFAGANSVVASHWEVDDAATRELMVTFIEETIHGRPLGEALRESQLRMIAKLQSERGHAHPFYWASFTLTGGGNVFLQTR